MALLYKNYFCITIYLTTRTANGDSSSCTDGGVGSRVLSTFLNELDGISSDSNCPVLVIVACSDVTSLDAAIVRPGRLQHHFELRALTEDDMGSIVEIQLSSYPHRCCDGMDSKDIVSAVIATNAHYSQFSRVASISPAVLVTICSNALLLAVKETIVEDGCNKMNASIQVSKRHIESAIQEYFFKLS